MIMDTYNTYNLVTEGFQKIAIIISRIVQEAVEECFIFFIQQFVCFDVFKRFCEQRKAQERFDIF